MKKTLLILTIIIIIGNINVFALNETYTKAVDSMTLRGNASTDYTGVQSFIYYGTGSTLNKINLSVYGVAGGGAGSVWAYCIYQGRAFTGTKIGCNYSCSLITSTAWTPPCLLSDQTINISNGTQYNITIWSNGTATKKKKTMKMITYKELSTPLKIAIISSYIIGTIYLMMILAIIIGVTT